MSGKSSVETRFEQGLFASRWLMAPMYLGLAVTLGMLTVIFVKELVYYLPQVLELSAEKMILVALTMIECGYFNGEDVRIDGAIRMAPR